MPRFTPEFLEELKSRLRPSDVIGRYVKLKKRGNTWWGLSPFNNEKTPSFTVSDQRGTYHCFSSQNHGDVIKFLTDTQGLSFHEAVERLAAEAGMDLPKGDPGEEARAQKRKGLYEACGAAAHFYSAILRRAEGRAGADYLRARGVTAEQIEAFALGYAPDSRTALKDYLINKGYREETLVEAGLLIKPDDGGPAFDRFRGRVMFPIRGAKDEIIAFGGRALDPNARAKYLNSPETPVFHKGDVLYNYGSARRAADEDKAPLIVCEGYMDVIALWGAGVRRAVAPLGTALGERQLVLLWRICDEPVLCFDGDKAGLSAAFRSIDRALPMLRPGKSLSFAFLPGGQDPDDLIRAGGAGAFKAVLDGALPLADVLWRRETENKRLDTPERRAALRSDLRSLVKAIADKDVRNAYGAELARRLDEAFAPPARAFRADRADRAGPPNPFAGRRARRAGGFGQPAWASPPRPSPALKRQPAVTAWRREATLVLGLVNHPALAERQESALLSLSLESPDLQALLDEALALISADPGLDSPGLKRHLQTSKAAGTLERVLSDDTLKRQRFLRPEAEFEEIERGWTDALRHHLAATDASREIADSASQAFILGDDVWKAAAAARNELMGSGDDRENDAGEGDAPSRLLEECLETLRKNVESRKRR
ncbi:MAG: DNA primase [Alphaproteobacteria bacterium]|nr:DNA primase [Alphaproteobacteria bacterium]